MSAVVIAILFGAGVGSMVFDRHATTATSAAIFRLCGWSKQNCIVDGDTIFHEGVKIRLADIDAPETVGSQCPSEAALGERAKQRLLVLMNLGPFEVVRAGRDEDQYGRKLRVIAENTLALVLPDRYPVTHLHTLIVSRRHAATYLDLHEPERRAISLLMDKVTRDLQEADRSIRGFNIGMNCGVAAGQTVGHVHVHLIPRRDGDVPDPRGGVRGVIAGKARY